MRPNSNIERALVAKVKAQGDGSYRSRPLLVWLCFVVVKEGGSRGRKYEAKIKGRERALVATVRAQRDGSLPSSSLAVFCCRRDGRESNRRSQRMHQHTVGGPSVVRVPGIIKMELSKDGYRKKSFSVETLTR